MVAFGNVKKILIDSQITFNFRWSGERNKEVSKKFELSTNTLNALITFQQQPLKESRRRGLIMNWSEILGSLKRD